MTGKNIKMIGMKVMVLIMEVVIIIGILRIKWKEEIFTGIEQS